MRRFALRRPVCQYAAFKASMALNAKMRHKTTTAPPVLQGSPAMVPTFEMQADRERRH